MTLPTGLLPAFVFVLTVGVSTLVTLGAVWLHRREGGSFGVALRTAFVGVGASYLVGVGVVWSLDGGGSLWGTAAALFAAGAVALVVLAVLPLAVGRGMIRRVRGVDSETALRFATLGWPLAMLLVFGMFVAPGGTGGGHLLNLGGDRVCLAGHCGIAVRLLGTVILQLFVAALGPGAVGLALYSSRAGTRGPQTGT